MQRNLSYLALAGLVLLGGCCCLKNGPGSAAVSLFNGRDLSGWKFHLADATVPAEKVWQVQDGVLVCRGEPMGYLYSEQSFSDFIMSVEYRWAPGQKPGNSGLFARINGPHQALPRCYETQLKHGDAGDLYGFHGMVLKGDAARAKHVPKHDLAGEIHGLKKLAGNEKPAGAWNTVEVQVRGRAMRVKLNGRLVNEATDLEILSGPVGLQSEGGEIHFRNVRLQPLSAP